MNLCLLKNPNFAVSNMLMLTLGAALYGTTVLIPLFLQSQMGYTAQKAGEVLSPGGFAILAFMPVVGFLVSRVDARYLIGIGFLTTALALFHMTNLNLSLDYRTFALWRIYQSAGLAFLFVPINTISYTGMPPEESNQVSGMINLMRNMGGDIGISAATALITHEGSRCTSSIWRTIHLSTIRDCSSFLQGSRTTCETRSGCFNSAATSVHADLSTGAAPGGGAVLYRRFLDLGGFLCLCAIGLLFLAKKNKPGPGPRHTLMQGFSQSHH